MTVATPNAILIYTSQVFWIIRVIWIILIKWSIQRRFPAVVAIYENCKFIVSVRISD